MTSSRVAPPFLGSKRLHLFSREPSRYPRVLSSLLVEEKEGRRRSLWLRGGSIFWDMGEVCVLFLHSYLRHHPRFREDLQGRQFSSQNS